MDIILATVSLVMAPNNGRTVASWRSVEKLLSFSVFSAPQHGHHHSFGDLFVPSSRCVALAVIAAPIR